MKPAVQIISHSYLSLALTVVLLFTSGIIRPGFSQSIYHTGRQEPVSTRHAAGVLLAGGATDNDDAMRWMLRQADGGDVVVLRASGSDGYNRYLFSELGVSVNSVTSIVITTAAHANSDEVIDIVKEAEVVFIAGGNQWNYVRLWRGTRLQALLNELINVKKITIGGTSAGMAVLGEVVFTAENNTIWSSEALEDPFHWRMKLERDFLRIPHMENTITDTHYNREENDDRDRRGRHTGFLARMVNDWRMPARGIASNEYTAVAVDERGMARVYGHPNRSDFAYFLQAYGGAPEVCEPGAPLRWQHDGKAVKVYRVKGDREGSGWFDLRDWVNGEGGTWEFWHVADSRLIQDPASISGRWLRFEVRDATDSTLVEGAMVGIVDTQSPGPPKAGPLLNGGYASESTNPQKSHTPRQTNLFGMAHFEDLNPALSYPYGVGKDGFFTWDGTADPGEENLAITVYLQRDDTSVPLLNTGTSGEQIHLHTYPNPATDWLWVRLPEDIGGHAHTTLKSGRLQVSIFTADGRMAETHSLDVVDMDNIAVNVSHLPSGVYLLEVGDGASRMVGRFLRGGP